MILINLAFLFLNLVLCYMNYMRYQEAGARETRLDLREVGLEEYANDLDTWDRAVKVREVQVACLISRAKKLKALMEEEK